MLSDQVHGFSGKPADDFLRHRRLPFMQVGISSVWYEGNPCNMHLNDLAADVKRGVEESGLTALMSTTNAFPQLVINHAPCLLERLNA